LLLVAHQRPGFAGRRGTSGTVERIDHAVIADEVRLLADDCRNREYRIFFGVEKGRRSPLLARDFAVVVEVGCEQRAFTAYGGEPVGAGGEYFGASAQFDLGDELAGLHIDDAD